MNAENGGSGLRGIWGVITRAETYLNIVYLILSMPLGVFYVGLLPAWFFTGLGLLILVIGIPVLGLMLMAARRLAGFEGQLANWLLDAGITPPQPIDDSWTHPWRSLKPCLADSFTWKGLAFLMLKLPLGILSFALTVALAAISMALILTPFFYRHAPVMVFDRRVSSPEEALILMAAGLLLGLVTLHVSNGLAAVWRALSRSLLSAARPLAAQPARTGPIVIP